MTRMETVVVLLLAAFGCGCGGGGGATAPTPASGPLGRLAVAGTYDIARTYRVNTCAATDIVDADTRVTGVVAHATGATRFTLTNSDGGRFGADLRSDAVFSNGVEQLIGANGVPYALLFAGHFTATGFRATVTVDLFRAQGTCRSMLDWEAVKQGAPNVLG